MLSEKRKGMKGKKQKVGDNRVFKRGRREVQKVQKEVQESSERLRDLYFGQEGWRDSLGVKCAYATVACPEFSSQHLH